MVVLQGKSVFRDICIGRLVFYRREERRIKRTLVADKEQELLRFEWARKEAARQLHMLYEETVKTVGAANAAIFEIHELMLEDAEFVESVRNMINTQNVNLEYAVKVTGDNMAQMLHSVEDAYMKERAQDMLDVAGRLLQVLTGEKNSEMVWEEPCIVAADDLMPSETVQLPRNMVLGFAMRKGSVHSHTAILARGMGIPAVMDIGEALSEEYDGLTAIIDGYTGMIYIEPDEQTLLSMREKKEQSERHAAMLHALKGKENITIDGRHVKVFANAGSLEEVDAACNNDAGGIGLFRSELLYLGRDSAPDEEEQFEVYRQVLEKMQGREAVIRTMDIGADKQVGYLGLDREENPALGLRAIRIGLQRPELFKVQLRALYRAGCYGRLRIMYPMITSMEEIHRLKELEEQVRTELTDRGIPFEENIPTGIMIETPAAALISDELARCVDFFSVGTNDLTQYTLAVDRQNASLNEFRNPHHRAVLKMIEMSAENAHAAGIWIGICGELAADFSLTESFIRMGIDELSVPAGLILPLRERIREIDLSKKDKKTDKAVG